MNRIAIDRLDLTLTGIDAAAAQAVQAELPGALRRQLARRLATAGASQAVLDAAGADLGTLSLQPRQDPRAVADAIAARLSDWVDARTERKGELK